MSLISHNGKTIVLQKCKKIFDIESRLAAKQSVLGEVNLTVVFRSERLGRQVE